MLVLVTENLQLPSDSWGFYTSYMKERGCAILDKLTSVDSEVWSKGNWDFWSSSPVELGVTDPNPVEMQSHHRMGSPLAF